MTRWLKEIFKNINGINILGFGLSWKNPENSQEERERDNRNNLVIQMLSNMEKLRIAANIPGEDHAKSLMRKVSEWYDEFCHPYRDEYPFNDFEFLKKFVASYVFQPDILASKGLEIFDRISKLESELKKLVKNPK